jgi:hypothetical protein
MAENGYTTIFHEGNEGVTIHISGTITTSEPPILRSSKPTGSNFWTVLTDGNKPKREEANNVYNLPSTKETIRYLHASADHPVEDTLAEAIKAGNFTMWPGLSVKAVHKYFPESDETKQGHMKKQCQNVQSTKIKIKPNEDETVPDLGNHEDIPTNAANPNTINNEQKAKPKKMCDMFIQIHNANNTAHSDQTGCFPVTSSSRNKYIMVLVEVNGNFIDVEPMKNKTAGSMIKAYLVLWKRLTASGMVKPTTHLLDNKASEEFKAVAPTVSAWQYVHGPFDYNKMPLTLMGCAVQIHKSSEQ